MADAVIDKVFRYKILVMSERMRNFIRGECFCKVESAYSDFGEQAL